MNNDLVLHLNPDGVAAGEDGDLSGQEGSLRNITVK